VVEHPFDADYPPEEAFAQSMEKAIMLTRYVNLLKFYIHDKKNGTASINGETGILPFLASAPTTGNPLSVYDELFQGFLSYFDQYAPSFTEASDLAAYKEKRSILLRAVPNARNNAQTPKGSTPF
jgi:hypothetical protein